MKAILPAWARAELLGRLPAGLDVAWFDTPAAATAAMPGAEIAWIDIPKPELDQALGRADSLKWLFTAGAGVDYLDLGRLAALGATVTNGSGLTAVAVAEYAVLGVLAAAKRYDVVVRLADRRRWVDRSPGRLELEGSRALVVGFGEIGRRIADRLAAFGVAVTGVTRSGRDGTLGEDAWRSVLGEFDWVVLAAPATRATRAMIGQAELAAMRPNAWLVNVGRGELVDQEALVDALRTGRIGGAFLDTVSPEPLPPDHPLWTAPNCLLSMHLSGRSQTSQPRRAANLFAENLAAYVVGRPMPNLVDLAAGY
jgi:phosphoglycerate dehydrogenase-like enzyme